MSEHHPKSAARTAILIAPWPVVPIVALAIKGGPHLTRLDLFVSGVFLGILFAGLPGPVGVLVGGLGGFVVVGREALVLCATSGLAVAITAWLIVRKSF